MTTPKQVLRVVAKADRFFRAGYQFGSTPVDLPLEEVSEESKALIRAEPMLVAYVVDLDKADAEVKPVEEAKAEVKEPAKKK
jgi:hypothetical protein